jgi:hypothetical protein
MSAIATVFSSFCPRILTVALADFSSTLTTVASVAAPLIVTFTLSPALTCGFTDVLASGDGETGAGVEAAGLLAALLFVFELFSGLGSQAASVNDSSTTAKSFFVIVVSIHPLSLSLRKEGCLPSSLGEWRKAAKHFMLS